MPQALDLDVLPPHLRSVQSPVQPRPASAQSTQLSSRLPQTLVASRPQSNSSISDRYSRPSARQSLSALSARAAAQSGVVANSKSWMVHGLILIIEIRTCTACSRVHRTPGTLHFLLRNKSAPLGHLSEWLIPYSDAYVTCSLPRFRREVHSTIQVCDGCFASVDPDQLLLFPSDFQPHLVRSARIAEIEAKEAAELEAMRRRLSKIAVGGVADKPARAGGASSAKPVLKLTLDDF